MQRDIAHYVTSCPDYTRSKTIGPRKPTIDLRSIQCDRPGVYVAMDPLGGLPRSWGNKLFIMVVSDLFIKYARFVSLPATDTITVADALLKDWILLPNPFENFLSDRGVQFTPGLFL